MQRNSSDIAPRISVAIEDSLALCEIVLGSLHLLSDDVSSGGDEFPETAIAELEKRVGLLKAQVKYVCASVALQRAYAVGRAA
jgi:hypothetical protein